MNSLQPAFQRKKDACRSQMTSLRLMILQSPGSKRGFDLEAKLFNGFSPDQPSNVSDTRPRLIVFAAWVGVTPIAQIALADSHLGLAGRTWNEN